MESPGAILVLEETTAKWWKTNCKPFVNWFMIEMGDEDRKKLLKKACPDMAEKAPTTEDNVKATDFLVPELTQESLLARAGRGFILLMTSRAIATDNYAVDIKMMYTLHKKQCMPCFSNGAFDRKFGLAFVDPMDPEGNIKGIAKDASEERFKEVRKHFEEGTLVEADVFLAASVRRSTFASFFKSVIEEWESICSESDKPAPTFAQLLNAENQMSIHTSCAQPEKKVIKIKSSDLHIDENGVARIKLDASGNIVPSIASSTIEADS